MYISTNVNSCCQECSCKKNCYIFGNCCPDFDLPAGLALPRPPTCSTASKLMNYNKQIRDIYSNKYRFIAYCPSSSAVSQDVVEKCYRPESLSDRIPVIHEDGDKLFRNVHCAKCHGYTSVIPWLLYLRPDCSQIIDMTFSSFEERDEFILNNCVLSAVPPANIRLSLLRCPKRNILEECSNSNLVNASIESQYLCGSLSSDIYNMIYKPFEMYNNPFCAICHGNIKNSVDSCVNLYGDTIKLPGLGFIVLLDMNPTQIKWRTSNLCSFRDVYDPFEVGENITSQDACWLAQLITLATELDVLGLVDILVSLLQKKMSRSYKIINCE